MRIDAAGKVYQNVTRRKIPRVGANTKRGCAQVHSLFGISKFLNRKQSISE
jgi:hypothetical protein